MVKTLILEGKMAKKFGKRVQFDVADLREMLRAMCSQVPGFKNICRKLI
jgi:predicted phage tail protein